MLSVRPFKVISRLASQRFIRAWPRTTLQATRTITGSPQTQSVSPLAPIGINAAIQASADPTVTPRSKIFEEFSLEGRVGIISGGNRGLGLEMALVLCELGARAIYCFDLPPEPSNEWRSVQKFVKKISPDSRLEYVAADVRQQKKMWEQAKAVGDKEGRMDVCIAAAGMLPRVVEHAINFPDDAYQEYQQICRPTNDEKHGVRTGKPWNTGEFDFSRIYSNTVSTFSAALVDNADTQEPRMTAEALKDPNILKRWSESAPLGRIGRSDELRGVVAWLASDASSFCTGSK
ncbi:hypothetical protein H0H92_011901 [Tricholoma furcatifolium]|nr:hypothetical protein H0H92_011901 [Tricholoma furcatifolium]